MQPCGMCARERDLIHIASGVRLISPKKTRERLIGRAVLDIEGFGGGGDLHVFHAPHRLSRNGKFFGLGRFLESRREENFLNTVRDGANWGVGKTYTVSV